VDRNWSFLNDADLAELRDLPHRLRLTAPTNSNAKILNVRCSCMSQVVRPSSRFTGYDTLGQVHSLPEAIALWKDHLNALDDSG
jgi:hypothetical protein